MTYTGDYFQNMLAAGQQGQERRKQEREVQETSRAPQVNPFTPPRGGRGSQEGDAKPVPSAFWQPPESVQNSKNWRYAPGGIFLGWLGEVPIGINDDRHVIMIAGARGGKTSTLLIPNLHLYKGATVVIDPKGELATATAEYRAKTLGHAVYVLDPWEQAVVPSDLRATFNPIDELSDGDTRDLIDDASLMAEALIEDMGENNAHWTSAARDFVRSLILWLKATKSNRSLTHLPELISRCMAVHSTTKPDDNPFFQMALFSDSDLPPAVSEVIRNAGLGMIGTPDKERASILSTARNQLGFLESVQIRDNLISSSFHLKELKEGSPKKAAVADVGDSPQAAPVTIYLCLPAARMGTHSRWLRVFLTMTMTVLERNKTKIDLPVLLMLEEFAALGHMRTLEQASAYMAGFGVKLWVVLQDLSQLKRHYKDGWETFIGNSGLLCAFANSDLTTLEYLSKRLGETAVYIEENTDINESDQKAGRSGIKKNFQRVPLMAPDEIALHFGRSHRLSLLIAAGLPAVVIERHFIDAPVFTRILNK